MTFRPYFADVAAALRARSGSIRRDFSTHRPTAGAHREDLVREFLTDHLPSRFGIRQGLAISQAGLFSPGGDVFIVDHLNNAPLYGASRQQLWPVEAIYALVEVKTTLGRTELVDAVRKGRAFKCLDRHAFDLQQPKRIAEPLYAIWGFDAPSNETFAENLVEVIADVPLDERPDLVVVPERLVATSGRYLEVSRLGQASSPNRTALAEAFGEPLARLLPVANIQFGPDALLAWYTWLDSWLRRAGDRHADPVRYVITELEKHEAAAAQSTNAPSIEPCKPE
jgi:hypothetical protein